MKNSNMTLQNISIQRKQSKKARSTIKRCLEVVRVCISSFIIPDTSEKYDLLIQRARYQLNIGIRIAPI
jgi:hypothetical protein